MLYINGMMAALTGFGLIVFLISSIREREWRAVCLASVFMIANFILWFVFIFWKDVLWIKSLNDGVIFLFVLFVFVSLLKWMPRSELRQTASIEQYDERDYMFSRNNLKNHPELAARYYAKFPEKAETDEKIHNKLEIGSPGQLYYEDYYAPVFDAAFVYLSSTRGAAVAAPRNEKKTVDKEKIKQVLRQIGYYYGAVDVGFSPLKSYHIYSHAGRRAETWGQEIKLEHQTAIVIVVAMDVHMIKKAPALPAILESSRQYVEAAKIANIIAEYVRGFGYQARAHTDGNYQVLCVPLAVDAGLGQLGRLGVLMHPVYGPCVRISVVTTDLKLAETEPFIHNESAAMIHFCKICKKCADNCPTQSIGLGDEPASRGVTHWSINQETCFSYWKNIGTDCGFCIRVCPYTKPDTFIHKLVRFYIARNPINQHIALKMDDLFYGRRQRIDKKNPEVLIKKNKGA